MSLHQLTSVTIGVPDVAPVAAYYAEFGLTNLGEGSFATADGGSQLRITRAPTRRLIDLTVGADDPDDLELGCAINGEEVQKSRTSHLIISVPQLVARLSAITRLLPGDIIFTGTPAGVGQGRTPQRWLAPGDELVSYVEGIGELRQRFVAAPD